jgi:PHD/YefM family antitoxin component YafN of YafNO toxin-antitoxin module
MYDIGMKTITTTNARKQLAKIVDAVKETGEVFAIGRRNKSEVILLKFPQTYNAALNEITNLNAISSSFDFLEDEPDIYTLDDAKEVYI